MAQKNRIDPLNAKRFGAVSAMLLVADIKAASVFYKKAFGFTPGAILKGPDGKPVHAELTIRGTTLTLGPANPERGARSAKMLGASPVTLYHTVPDVDKAVAKAVKLGATIVGPVMDMFWGDRVGTIVDPDGYPWMIATHRSEPTAQEMTKAMKEQMTRQNAIA